MTIPLEVWLKEHDEVYALRARIKDLEARLSTLPEAGSEVVEALLRTDILELPLATTEGQCVEHQVRMRRWQEVKAAVIRYRAALVLSKEDSDRLFAEVQRRVAEIKAKDEACRSDCASSPEQGGTR